MKTRTESIITLVCGILGLVGGFIPYVKYFTLVLAIVAIVLGSKTQKAARVAGESTAMATTGMVLGIIGVAFTVLLIACTGFIIGACASALPDMAELLQ